jgi:putative ABC transport system ATP-binding protein
VTQPLIVLADEPTANLDSDTGHKIVELMRTINEVEKTTLIFSTHDQHIMEHARKVVNIRDGLVTGVEQRN